MKKRNWLSVLVMAFVLVAGFGQQAFAQCIGGIPLAKLELTGVEDYTDEGGNNWVKYYIGVVNWESYPDEWFEPAPDLPPCGINTESSRTWVDIYNAEDDSRIYGFCALSSNESLQNLWFAVPEGQEPSRIYVKFDDRRCDYDNYYSYDLIVSGPKLHLIGMEVNQVIQDWENTVSLIQGKTTYVRAHIKKDEVGPVIADVRLRGFSGVVELEGSPLTAINPGTEENPGGTILAPSGAIRNDWERSLNFRLPSSWLSGTITLQLESAEWEMECLEAAGTPNDCSVEVTFLETGQPRVAFVAVDWTDEDGTIHTPADEDIDELAGRLLAIYPMADFSWSSSSMSYSLIPESFDDLANINSALSLRKMLNCRQLSGFAPPPDCNALYYGVLVDADNVGGLANDIPGTVASGNMPSNPLGYGRQRAAHELAHVLGSHHAVNEEKFGTRTINYADGSSVTYKRGACNEIADLTAPDFPFMASIEIGINRFDRFAAIGPMDLGDDSLIYGLDTNEMWVVDPYEQHELMSYCGSNEDTWKWISPYTYDNLRFAINNLFPPPGRFTLERELIMIRVEVDFDLEKAIFRPMTRIVTGAPVEPIDPGDYLLQLRNTEGTIIESIAFQPIAQHPDFPAEDPRAGSIIISTLANPAIAEAAVIRNGVELGSISASANPPSVQVVYPNGGESLSGEYVTAQWTGSDPDGDDLTYILQYSTDGGATWETLDVDIVDTSYDIALSLLRGTGAGLIRIMASDGFNTASDDSDGVFAVPYNPPSIVVVSPGEGAAYSGAQQVFFEAYAMDREDGRLPGSGIEWISLIDGSLGTGEVINMQATALSEGEHTIMVIATDSDGLTGSKIVTIRVFRGVPDLTAPQIYAGEDITVECQGIETPVPLPMPTVSDTLDPDPVVTNDAPKSFPPGCTTVTFTATDSAGNTATDSIEVCAVDTTAPDASLSVSPNVLWPPNHRMVEVIPSIQASDTCCDSDLSVSLVSVHMDEADTQSTFDPAFDLDPTSGYLGEDIQIVDGRISLRAERAGNSNGRVYTITYSVTDCSGNSSLASATITVPHDMD